MVKRVLIMAAGSLAGLIAGSLAVGGLFNWLGAEGCGPLGLVCGGLYGGLASAVTGGLVAYAFLPSR